jgi:glycerol-3-phosphate acyltransferase PlsY
VDFDMTLPIFIIIAAYLIGSISFAIIVSYCMGLSDPRTFGSNNPGATNVLRTGKKWAAALTLLGDGAKGWVVISLTTYLFPMLKLTPGSDSLLLFGVAIAVMVGHMWPVFFRFHGGKGVATALGVMLGFSPWLALSVFAVWLIIALIFRISSLSALIAALSAPFLALYWLEDKTAMAAIFIIAAFVIRRHKKNIIDLLSNQENKIGQSSK